MVMHFCRVHAERISHERNLLGLEGAKMRLELIGIDPDSREMDGYVCPVCLPGATCSTRRDLDGKFFLSIVAALGPRNVYE